MRIVLDQHDAGIQYFFDPHPRSPAFLLRPCRTLLFFKIQTVVLNDFLIPVERIFSDSIIRAVALIIKIDINVAVTLGDLLGRFRLVFNA